MKVGIVGYGIVGHATEQGLGRSGQLLAVYDEPKGLGSREEINTCDVVYVSVPTPSGDPDEANVGALDLTILESVMEWLGPRPVIALRSTVPVGTSRRLSKEYNRQIVYHPAFFGEAATHPWRTDLDPGWGIFGTDLSLVDIDGDRPEYLVECLWPTLRERRVVSWEVAEMVKLVFNAWWATKITFVNEIAALCDAVGIHYDDLRSAWLTDTRVGTSYTRSPKDCGPGFGGKCLPKDLAQLINEGWAHGYSPYFLFNVVRRNLEFKEVKDEGLRSDTAAS